MMIPRHCEDCDLINLGTYSFGSYQGISDKVSLVDGRGWRRVWHALIRITSSQVSTEAWNAGRNNMGFGMDRHTWNRLRGCSKVQETGAKHYFYLMPTRTSVSMTTTIGIGPFNHWAIPV